MQVVRYKRCTHCDEYRPLERYSPAPRMSDGHQSWCKDCQAEYARQWRKRNPDKQREQGRRKYAKVRVERPEAHRRRINAWRLNNLEHAREQGRANLAVAYAVRTGRLIRPETCTECGGPGPIEGHHPDYDKPLDVEWLCRICHRAADKRRQEAASEHPLDVAGLDNNSRN